MEFISYVPGEKVSRRESPVGAVPRSKRGRSPLILGVNWHSLTNRFFSTMESKIASMNWGVDAVESNSGLTFTETLNFEKLGVWT